MANEKQLILHFEHPIKEQINSNHSFSKFIKQVELGLHEFLRTSELKLICTFKMTMDFEIPHWEKLILDISLDHEKMDFREKILLWDKLDDAIRGKITTFLNSLIKDSDKISITNLNKKFYIEINPL